MLIGDRVVQIGEVNVYLPFADREVMGEGLIELGLQQRLDFMALADQILAILPEAAPESERLGSTEFREEISRSREQLKSNRPAEPIISAIVQRTKDYFSRARTHQLDREREYVELVDVLRNALSKFAGESEVFNSQIVTSSERFTKLAEIDDIREIKNRISREVQNLRRAAVEKQKRDEQQVTALTRRVETLQVRLTRAKDEAATDALTRIANRGSFNRTLAEWVAGSTFSESSFVLVLADIDDFKKINDTRGHVVGDRVLLGAAQLLTASLRKTDFVARYGGEEFALLLAGIRLAEAEPRIATLLKTVAAHRFEYEAGFLQFTLSCGLAEFSTGDTAETIVARADQALYEAKRKGKNRVISKRRSILRSMFS